MLWGTQLPQTESMTQGEFQKPWILTAQKEFQFVTFLLIILYHELEWLKCESANMEVVVQNELHNPTKTWNIIFE